jgi:hypothetical protein
MQTGPAKSDEEVRRTLDNLEMMRRRHLWPTEGALCLKNPDLIQEGGWPAFAVLFFEGERQGYYFLPGLDKEKARTGGDELLRELVGEGWLVD